MLFLFFNFDLKAQGQFMPATNTEVEKWIGHRGSAFSFFKNIHNRIGNFFQQLGDQAGNIMRPGAMPQQGGNSFVEFRGSILQLLNCFNLADLFHKYGGWWPLEQHEIMIG